MSDLWTDPNTSDQPQTKEALVYRDLLDMIIGGELPRGEFLSQRMLAGKCGSNVVTVRAALRHLENDRLIESVPQWGVRIPEETEGAARDRYYLRTVLELAAVRSLVSRRHEVDGGQLLSAADACDLLSAGPASDYQTYAHRHYQFHQTLIDMSGSRSLAEAYARLWMRTVLLWNAVRGWHRGYDRSPSLHRDLAKAVLERGEHEATAAMEEHIENGLQLEINALREAISER